MNGSKLDLLPWGGCRWENRETLEKERVEVEGREKREMEEGERGEEEGKKRERIRRTGAGIGRVDLVVGQNGEFLVAPFDAAARSLCGGREL